MRQIMPIAGAVVGGIFGAPQLGFAIGSMIGNAVDPLEVQGRKLGDAPTQVAAEGGARAIVFGKGCIRATVILERGGRRVVKQRDKSGGKGGGPTTVNERAFWTYAIGLGEAIPGGAILRVWENEKLVYDVTPASQIVQDSTEFAKLFRFYDGAEDQLPDPAIEAIYTDPTDAPYYRGTAYMVFPQRDLTDFGEAVPTYRVEVGSSVSQPEINEVFDGYYSSGGYPEDPDGVVYDPTPGEVFIIPFWTSSSGHSCIVEIVDDWGDPSFVPDLYEYTIVRQTGFDEYEETQYSRKGGGFIGLNLVAGEVYFIRCDPITPPPGTGMTKVRANWYFYSKTLEQLLSDNGVVIEYDGTLGSVVASLHSRCGHDADDYDVAPLSDVIDGIVIESTQTGAEAINSLIGTHWADPADYDGKIRYIKRGAAVVRTLTIDDLIDEPETWQRNNAIEYPAKMHFFGQIADLAYASVKATSARYSADAKVVGEASVSSPETFNDSQRPYEIAAILHKIMWTEAGGEVTWRVTDQHLDLVPTDCVGLSWAGQLWRARITQIESDPGELKLKMMLDRQSAYTANLTAIPIPPPVTPPQTSIVSDTVLAIMDLPALTDNSDTLHYYAAMSGETDAWAGAVLQQSLDGGSTFTTVGETRINSIMGILQEPLPAGLEWYTDETNAVVVELYTDDDLESRSGVEFLNGGGAFALSYSHGGNRPTWEVMQFRDAEKIGPKLWKLTTLHRGQKGTIPNTHSPGDQFVLLDSSVLRLPAQVAWLWAGGAPPGETARPPLVHRAVSNGRTPDTADVVESLYLGFSQREWSTAQVMAERDGGTITASVIPRQRFGTSMNPIRSVNFEGYEWQVATTPSGDVLTTVTTGPDEPSVTMTVAWPGPVVVSCVLRNRLTGAGGFAATRFPGEPGFSAITLD